MIATLRRGMNAGRVAWLCCLLPLIGSESAAETTSAFPSNAKLPWVVKIDTVGGAAPLRDSDQRRAAFRPADGPTTGVIWSRDGLIVTSSFNFARDPLVILVTLPDGRQLVGDLIARDRPMRLALLRVKAEDLPTPPLVDADALPLGSPLWVAGWGYAGDRPALTRGVLSAHRRIRGMALQTDANTSPANYGGPLLDSTGRMIGLVCPLSPNRQARSEFSGVDFYDSGIGFAIHADIVAQRVGLMADGSDLLPGQIGVRLDPRRPVVGNPEGTYEDQPIVYGALITSIAGLPASEHNICAGDIIVAVDGVEVTSTLEVIENLALCIAGDVLRLELERDGACHEVTLTLAGPEQEEPAKQSEQNLEALHKRMQRLRPFKPE
jgi:serine protease Do